MSYSHWVEKNGFLGKLTVGNSNIYSDLLTVIQELCNQTVSGTAKVCSDGSLNYQCSGNTASSRIAFFNCAGYVSTGCALTDQSCQTAGLADPAMNACIQASMKEYAGLHNMTCDADGPELYHWLAFSMALCFPICVFFIFMLAQIVMKSGCTETNDPPSKTIPIP